MIQKFTSHSIPNFVLQKNPYSGQQVKFVGNKSMQIKNLVKLSDSNQSELSSDLFGLNCVYHYPKSRYYSHCSLSDLFLMNLPILLPLGRYSEAGGNKA